MRACHAALHKYQRCSNIERDRTRSDRNSASGRDSHCAAAFSRAAASSRATIQQSVRSLGAPGTPPPAPSPASTTYHAGMRWPHHSCREMHLQAGRATFACALQASAGCASCPQIALFSHAAVHRACMVVHSKLETAQSARVEPVCAHRYDYATARRNGLARMNQQARGIRGYFRASGTTTVSTS
jgi:hypothetical protein